VKLKVIFLIEDDANDEELTRHALRKGNVANEIVVAHDGVGALDYLFCTGRYAGRDLLDTPALILLDFKLPKIDGMEVLRRIRADERFRALPVVAMTSSPNHEQVLRGGTSGITGWVRKPVAFDQLTRIVAEAGMFWLLVDQAPRSR
jgi:two-component system response regulator